MHYFCHRNPGRLFGAFAPVIHVQHYPCGAAVGNPCSWLYHHGSSLWFYGSRFIDCGDYWPLRYICTTLLPPRYMVASDCSSRAQFLGRSWHWRLVRSLYRPIRHATDIHLLRLGPEIFQRFIERVEEIKILPATPLVRIFCPCCNPA